MKLISMILFILNFYFVQDIYAKNYSVNYNNAGLNLFIPSSKFIPSLNSYLNQYLTKRIVDTSTEEVSLKNFRTKLYNNKIRIFFNYSAKHRGWTKRPFGGRWYTRWISDSGWVEIDIWLKMKNWNFSAYSASNGIRWDSNNWFTRNIVRGLVDREVRTKVSNAINQQIKNILGGSSLNMRSIFINEGTYLLQHKLKISHKQANAEVLSALTDNIKLDTYIRQNGINIKLHIPKYIVTCIENKTNFRIHYDSQWENEPWQNNRILPNRARYHSLRVSSKSYKPSFRIRYDYLLNDNNKYKTHYLNKKYTFEQSCKNAEKYFFKKSRNILSLYEKNN